MADFTDVQILNGVTPIDIFGRTEDWGGDSFIARLRIRLPSDTDTGQLELRLDGSWDIETMRLSGNPGLDVVYRDIGGGDRDITSLFLADGDNRLILPLTEVGYIDGDDGDSSILLGQSVNAVRLGSGDDDVKLQGFAGYVNLGDGTNTAEFRDGFDALVFGRGDNTIKAVSGFGGAITGYTAGDNAIFIGSNADVRSIGTSGGRETLILNDGGRVSQADLGGNDDIAILKGTSSIGSLNLGGGANRAEIRGGTVNHVNAYGENDTLLVVAGRVESALLGGGANALVVEAAGKVEQYTTFGENDLARVRGEVIGMTLGSGQNEIRVEGGTVSQVQAFDGRDVLIVGGGGWVGQARLGEGPNAVLADGGFVDMLRTGGGADEVTMRGDGRVDVMSLGSGDNLVRTANSFVNSITAYEGDDTVFVGAAGAGMIKLDAGNNVLRSDGGGGYVDAFLAFGGNDVALVGTSGAGLINLGGGANRLRAEGFIEAIVTYDGRDDLELTGGAGSVRTGNGNDVVRVSERFYDLVGLGDGDDIAIVGRGEFDFLGRIIGGQGNDRVDLAPLDLVLDVDLTKGGDWQQVTSGASSLATTWLQLESIEQVFGGRRDDVLRGNDADNLLVGRGGDDTLLGRAGDDVLAGQTGSDSFVFGTDDGADRIIDWTDGQDRIELSGSTSAADATLTQVGSDVRVDYGATSILVVGATVGQLQYDDDGYLF